MISPMRLLLTFLTVCFVFQCCPCTQAGVIYSNTSLTGPATAVLSTGLFDDVLIPSSLDQADGAIAITQVTVGVNFSAGPADFSLWATGANNDSSPAGTPFLLASQTVVSPGLVTFGNGVTPMAVVKVNSTAVPGFELLYLGLTSNNAVGESWQWASGPNSHLPTAYFRSDPVGSPGTTTYFPVTAGPGFPSDISYYVNVQGFAVPDQGNAVPEPSSLSFVGIGGVCGVWLTRRQIRRRCTL
jgi:hypothetical protein